MLPTGAIKAIKSTRLRVPEGTDDVHAELAQRALDRMVDVMDERVGYRGATSVLAAATRIREEVCGPVVKRLEVDGGITVNLRINTKEEK